MEGATQLISMPSNKSQQPLRYESCPNSLINSVSQQRKVDINGNDVDSDLNLNLDKITLNEKSVMNSAHKNRPPLSVSINYTQYYHVNRKKSVYTQYIMTFNL